MQPLSFRVAFLTLLLSITLDAQWSDRLYPIRELTDEMRARIDLRDGSVEDWSEVLGEPALTPLDFATYGSYPKYDPSSFDFRIWLAWHDAGNHLFVAAEIVDDTHVGMWPDNPPDWAPADRPPNWAPVEGTVHFMVDGDRSGGAVIATDDDDAVVRDITMGQAQIYWAVAETHEKAATFFWIGWARIHPGCTRYRLPMAEGGIVDSQPAFYVIEFYVSPFDRLIWDAPEQSLVSDLSAGKVIEFGMHLGDADADPLEVDRLHFLFAPDASWEQPLTWMSDLWGHGILLGANSGSDGTAVENVTWARFKASLSE